MGLKACDGGAVSSQEEETAKAKKGRGGTGQGRFSLGETWCDPAHSWSPQTGYSLAHAVKCRG